MRKHVEVRRQQLRELAEREAAKRCRRCKVPLSRVRLEMGEPFCSTDCADDDAEFQERWAAARARVTS